jgi:hypothetical protein
LPEAKLRANGNELPPIDYLLEYGELPNIRALPSEVKASITNNVQRAIDELSRLNRYSGSLDLIGENGEVKRYASYCIVLVLHQFDSTRIINIINDAVKTDTLRMPDNYAVWDFGIVASTKPGQGDVMHITSKSGKTGCADLDGMIANDIVVPINDIATIYETLKFTPAKPPLVYTLVMLWQCVLGYLAKGEKTLVTKDTEVINAVREYYGTWMGKSPIKSDWIREALGSLCNWGLAVKKDDDSNTYEIFLQKPKEKDLQKYFCEKICGREETHSAYLDSEQKIMSEFSNVKSIPKV